MKNKFIEALFSLLALYLFACVIAAAMVLGMLLVPIVFVALFIMAIRDLITRKRKAYKAGQAGAVKLKGKVITISSWIPHDRKAA